MGVAFRYAAALSIVRYSVGARHSLFARIRLNLSWGPPSTVYHRISWLLYRFGRENIVGSSENIPLYSFGFEVTLN